MNELWNNLCVLISRDGNVILSDELIENHDEAIIDCGSKVGADTSLNTFPTLVESLIENNHVVLLNCGNTPLNDGSMVEKRTGYLALPEKLTLKQVTQMQNLMLLIDLYKSLTVWKLEDGKLNTTSNSIGEMDSVVSLIQNMINESMSNVVFSTRK